MSGPTIAHPETLKLVQTVHDTVHVAVGDTIVRVAEPSHSGLNLTAVTAAAVTITAGLGFWTFIRERIPPDVQIDYDFDAHNSPLRHTHYGALPPNKERCIMVSVRNRASKPIVVERVDVQFLDGDGLRDFHSLRAGKAGELGPGEKRHWFLSKEAVRDYQAKGAREIIVVIRGKKSQQFPLTPKALRTDRQT